MDNSVKKRRLVAMRATSRVFLKVVKKTYFWFAAWNFFIKSASSWQCASGTAL